MPTPIELPLSGQTDSNGNLQVSRVVRAAYWALVWCTGSCTGTGQWVLGKVGSPRAFQSGADVVLGPLTLAPGEEAVLTVAGAQPSTPVTATLWGWQGSAPDGSDLAPLAGSVESAGSLVGVTVPIGISGPVAISGNVPVVNAPASQLAVVRQQSQLTGSPFTAAAGTTTKVTFSLSPSAHAVAILIGNAGGCAGVTVTGVTSGITYLSQTPSSAGPIYFVPVVVSVDGQITVSVTTYNGQTSQVWVAELDDPEAVAVESNSGHYNTLQYDPFGNLLGVGDFTQQSGYSSLSVTRQWSKPAPWEAPATSKNVAQTFTANTDYTLIAGVTGQTIYLHSVNLVWDATAQWELALYDGPSSGGKVIGELSLFVNPPPPIDFRGRPLTAGNPLVARSNGTVNGRGTITWSQQ